MYKCSSCGEIFDEPALESEHIGVMGCQSVSTEYLVCPCCGEDGYYEEIFQCSICGEYCDDLEDDVCKNCINDTRKQFMAMWDEFTEEQKEVLRNLELVGGML